MRLVVELIRKFLNLLLQQNIPLRQLLVELAHSEVGGQLSTHFVRFARHVIGRRKPHTALVIVKPKEQDKTANLQQNE